MKERYLIATDLDGTLLTENGIYEGFSRYYFKSLKEQGHTIVIVTGRTFQSAINALKPLDFVDYIIANCGSVIYDVDKSKIIYLRKINKIELDKVTSILISSIEKFEIRDLYSAKFVESNDYCEEFKKTDIISMLVAYPRVDYDINNVKIKLENITDKISFNIMMDSFASNQRFNVSSFEVSKFKAIEWLRDRIGINSKHVITFGDGLNDIDMIAGYEYGVAVKNALPEVKKVAKYITNDNQEQGVLNFLKDFFK